MARDRILLHGLTFFGYHGVLDDERRDGRRYTVDITVDADLGAPGLSDDLDHTVDYRGLAQSTVEIGTERRFDLLEALAQAIADAALAQCPEGTLLTVRVSKHSPRLAGSPPTVAVEIRRGGGLTGT